MNSFFNVRFFWEVSVTPLVITDPQLLTGEAADPGELERNKANIALLTRIADLLLSAIAVQLIIGAVRTLVREGLSACKRVQAELVRAGVIASGPV